MKATILLAALLAAPLGAIAQEVDDVIVWTTVIEWVGPGGTPIAAPAGDQALGSGANGQVAEHNKNPAPAQPAAPVANDKMAIHNNGGGQQGSPANNEVQTQANPVPVVASSTAPAPAPVVSTAPSSPQIPGSSGGGGGFAEGTCEGEGMNIFWTGDEVNYTINYTPENKVSGTTTGCTNLGNFDQNIDIGGVGGTLFEATWGGGGIYQFFDVSLIHGFSVPAMCKAGGVMSGCSIDLHSQDIPCPSSSDGTLCKNPTGPGGSHDPGSYAGDMAADPWCWACSAPDPFFAACSGAAYTFPYDDHASVQAGGTITCCVGTSCGSSGREGTFKGGNPQPTRPGQPCSLCPSSQGKKRDLEDVLANPQPLTPSLLPRKHKRHQHQHRHAAMHEAKQHL